MHIQPTHMKLFEGKLRRVLTCEGTNISKKKKRNNDLNLMLLGNLAPPPTKTSFLEFKGGGNWECTYSEAGMSKLRIKMDNRNKESHI